MGCCSLIEGYSVALEDVGYPSDFASSLDFPSLGSFPLRLDFASFSASSYTSSFAAVEVSSFD